MSRVLHPSEKNYSATELEMLAVYWSISKLFVFLEGSRFQLVTDHSALRQMFSLKTENRRLRKWSVELSPYKPYMSIIHRPGKENGAADCLSRLFKDEPDIEED